MLYKIGFIAVRNDKKKGTSKPISKDRRVKKIAFS